MQLFRPEAITWRKSGESGMKILTDHNRSAISVNSEIIERKQRMVDGTMRKYHISSKRTFSWSYEMLPSKAAAAVGESTLPILAGEEMLSFVNDVQSSNSCDGDFYMKIYSGQHDRPDSVSPDEIPPDIHVMVSEFNYDIVKRGAVLNPGDPSPIEYDFWSVNITLEEV